VSFLQLFQQVLPAGFLQVCDRNREEQPIWGHLKSRKHLPSWGNKYPLLSLSIFHCKQAQGSPKGLRSSSILNFLRFCFLSCLHLGESLAKPTIQKRKARNLYFIFIIYLYIVCPTCHSDKVVWLGFYFQVFISSILFSFTHLCTKPEGFVLHLVHLLWLFSLDLLFKSFLFLVCLHLGESLTKPTIQNPKARLMLWLLLLFLCLMV
jgi:hypothetical protein